MSHSDDGAADSLATRTINLETKRFYLDVKVNQRGHFVQVSEVSPEGRKNQIMMAWSTAVQFNTHLKEFVAFTRGLGEVNPNSTQEGELKSEVMFMNDKKYHIDLKENARGRFLKVTERLGRSRFQVFLPAEGLKEFQHNLSELLDENYGADDEECVPEVRPRETFNGAPKGRNANTRGNSKQVKIENKNFYFDINENQQGKFMTITEVSQNFRKSVLVPESGWEAFRDALDEIVYENNDN